MFILLGTAIVVITIVLLIMKYDAKMVLIGSGLLMATCAGTPLIALDAFQKSMTSSGLIAAICSCMGFAMAMRFTGCDRHLIYFLANLLKRFHFFLIPGAVAATYFVNMALPSAAGTAAAAGAVFIPLMMAGGVHPAMAAAAVKAGTYGSMLNPGLAHNAMVAKITQLPVMDVIAFHHWGNWASLITACILLSVIAFWTKEYRGYTPENLTVDTDFRINYIYALMPLVPLVLLLLGSTGLVPSLKMGVPHAMVLGSILTILITRSHPAKLASSFFKGMGEGYGNIMSIVIAAGVFVSGMTAMGLVKAFTTAMLGNPAIMKIAAAVGPFVLGFITGSGDAATIAFNEAITPHALDFGISPLQMGSIATLGGTLGRTISPIAGATIIVAGIAGCDPFEVTKRNGIPIIAALIVGTLVLIS